MACVPRAGSAHPSGAPFHRGHLDAAGRDTPWADECASVQFGDLATRAGTNRGRRLRVGAGTRSAGGLNRRTYLGTLHSPHPDRSASLVDVGVPCRCMPASELSWGHLHIPAAASCVHSAELFRHRAVAIA